MLIFFDYRLEWMCMSLKKLLKSGLCLLLVLVLCGGMFFGIFNNVNAATSPTEQDVYQKMIAMKSQYPEGTIYTNLQWYKWRGSNDTGYGCVGFAMILSDAAFGNLPAKKVYNFTYNQVRVGDLLRINNDSHTVIILEKYDDHVVTAEGNNNFMVHWGGTLTKAQVERGNFIWTRYPGDLPPAQGSSAPKPTPTPSPTPVPSTPVVTNSRFVDVPSNAFYAKPVEWAVNRGITTGVNSTHFAPNNYCTRADVVTFIWRAYGCPQPRTQNNPFTDVSRNAYYYKAVLWAVNAGITSGVSRNLFQPDGICTRGQVVTFLYRAYGNNVRPAYRSVFSDVPDGAYFTNAVMWAVNKNITKGTSASLFSPYLPCTRGEIVTFLYRCY